MMEKYEPSFDPYRDLKRGEERKCTYQPSEWQGKSGEKSTYVRIAILSSDVEMDWTNDPHLGRDYFGGGAGFSRLPEQPVFQLGSASLDDVPDFHWYRSAAVVRRAWVDFCLELDAAATQFIPIRAVLANGEPAPEQLYVWDIVRVIDAIDWGRTTATVIKSELNGEDYLYNRGLKSITLRPDISPHFQLFRDRIERTTVFCTRSFEQQAAGRGLKGFAMGDLFNDPHTVREHYSCQSDFDDYAKDQIEQHNYCAPRLL